MRKRSLKRLAVLLALTLSALCACAPAVPAESGDPSRPEPQSQSSQSVSVPEESSSGQPEPEEPAEPEEPKSPAEIIMDSYYLDDAPEVKDSYDMITAKGLTMGRLAPMYTTGTSGEEEMLALLEKLRAGEKLADLLQPEERYYALVYDGGGKIAGHIEVGKDLKIGAFAEFIEESAPLYRWDFRFPELLEQTVAEGKIDPAAAQLKFCNFADFATGALLYDGNQEYFIPTVGDALHTVEFQVGTLYPVPELAETLNSRIGELFPENEVDGFGNPYTA